MIAFSWRVISITALALLSASALADLDRYNHYMFDPADSRISQYLRDVSTSIGSMGIGPGNFNVAFLAEYLQQSLTSMCLNGLPCGTISMKDAIESLTLPVSLKYS
ncbi:hypothetical protein WDW86_16065 [Bdellovibrionota bacterium FG-2]